jgi:prevent-host-death family protein
MTPVSPLVQMGVQVPLGLCFSAKYAQNWRMSIMPLGEVRARLSEVIETIETTHERIITIRHGKPVAIVLSTENFESMEETLEILASPGARAAINEGEPQSRPGTW